MDRKKQRAIQDWDNYHKKYVYKFSLVVRSTLRMKAGAPIDPFVKKYEVEQHPFSQEAFDTYLRWFLERTRVEVCGPAFEEDMLEEYIPPNELQEWA